MTRPSWRLGCLAAAALVLAGCPGADAAGPEPCENELTTLANGFPVTASASLACDAVFMIQVPENSSGLTVTVTGGTGYSDLYVRRGTEPTPSEYLCYDDQGNADVCEIRNPNWSPWNQNQPIESGDWYIRVTGDIQDAVVEAEVYELVILPEIIRLQSGVPRTGQSAEMGSQTYYEVVVPVGSRWIEVKTSGGTGDADLYIGRGITPETMEVECSSNDFGNTDRCLVTNPVAGLWYIELYSFSSYAGLTITATAGSGTPPGDDGGLQSPFAGSWRRYGNPNGYQDDLKVGGIPGQPANRVYLCTLPPTPNPALYKGVLLADGVTIRWDAGHGIPDYQMQATGSNTMQFFVPAAGAVGGRYERANWRPGSCGLTL